MMRISLKKQGIFSILGAILLVGLLFFGFAPLIVSQVPDVSHVVIIGCDGHES